MEKANSAAKQEVKKVDVFLAGVIQGSQPGEGIESQNYRDRLRDIFARVRPDLDVYCPFENHSSSIEYDDEKGRQVFLYHLEMCKKARMIVAYLPTASLGTSIEIWESRKSGVPVVAISPMEKNWVLRFFTDVMVPDLEAFESWLASEEASRLLS